MTLLRSGGGGGVMGMERRSWRQWDSTGSGGCGCGGSGGVEQWEWQVGQCMGGGGKFFLSGETTAKGTGLGESEGKEDLVDLDS